MNRYSVIPTIYSQQEALRQLENYEYKNALVVTDKVMREIGMVDKLIKVLEKKANNIEVFDEVLPDPSVAIVTKGMEEYLKSEPDLVVALGGGSVIDTAKAIMYSIYKSCGKENFVKPVFAAIPTTSGTGSEVTSFSVIKMESEKICLVDDWMCPDVAILDPEFVKSVPKNVTADTGMDALVHALEAYVSPDANDFTDALAEKAVSLVFNYLLDAYRDGSCTVAREKMHNASCMAGMAFTNAGLGINHSLAHALGALFHVPHGRANALLVTHVIQYNMADERACSKYAKLARMMRIEGRNDIESTNNLIKAIMVLKKEMNMPKSIMSTGVKKEDFANKLDQLSRTALKDSCTLTNPKQPKAEDLKKIYTEAF